MSWKDIDNYPGRNPKDTREWIANILDVIKSIKGTDRYFENPGTNMKEMGRVTGKVNDVLKLLPKITTVLPKFSVTDFGAVGDYDGTVGTNNANAFISAIQALPNYNGRIYIPEGKFLIDGLTLNCGKKNAITFEGSGKFTTIIHSKNLSTLIKKKSGNSIMFKDLSIVVDTVPKNTTMNLIDLKAVDVEFENVNIVINPIFKALSTHNIIKVKKCPFTSFKELSIIGSLIPEKTHKITGRPCYNLSSIGIVSEANELITFSNVFMSGVSTAIQMKDEEGSYINGLILDNVYKGVEYIGACINNTISGMRYKSNIRSVLQVQHPDNVCAVYYGENSRANTIIGRTHETHDMFFPHNTFVIDLGRDNKYESNIQSKVYKKFPINQLVVNNNFKYWRQGKPLNWQPIAQKDSVITFTKSNDGRKSFVTVNGITENLSGIKTDPFIYDPDIHGDILNISFEAKLPEGDNLFKIVICDAETNKIILDCGIPRTDIINDFVYPYVGKWKRYTVTKTLDSIKRFIVLKLVCVKDHEEPVSIALSDVELLTGDIGASEYPLINNYNMLNGLPDDDGNFLTGEIISLNPTLGYLNAVYIIPADSTIGRWAVTNPVQCLRYV